jgi:hypothetical protein
MSESGRETVLVLDDWVRLRFEGLQRAEYCDEDLMLGPFDRLFVSWEADGEQIEEFTSGQVRLSPPYWPSRERQDGEDLAA